MISAFTNIFKILELRQRALHAGDDHHRPGGFGHLDARGEFGSAPPVVPQRGGRPGGRRRGGPVQPLQRRRARSCRHLRPRDHAVHQRIHHDAAHDRRGSAPRSACAAGRRTPEDLPIHATRPSSSACSKDTCWRCRSGAPSRISFLPGIMDTINRLGIPLVDNPGCPSAFSP